MHRGGAGCVDVWVPREGSDISSTESDGGTVVALVSETSYREKPVHMLVFRMDPAEDDSTGSSSDTGTSTSRTCLCPNQHSVSPTKKTTSHSPRASLLGSISDSPMSVLSTSSSNTPRSTFMASTFAALVQ